MKTLHKTFIFFVMIFTIYSCENNNTPQFNTPITDQDGEKEEETEEERYYIKYTATCVCRYTVNMEVKVNTEQGLTTFVCGKSFSETFGPVPKGFKCEIIGTDPSSSTEDYSDITVSIHVSRGKEPFVLKATDNQMGSSQTSYTIDF